MSIDIRYGGRRAVSVRGELTVTFDDGTTGRVEIGEMHLADTSNEAGVQWAIDRQVHKEDWYGAEFVTSVGPTYYQLSASLRATDAEERAFRLILPTPKDPS